MEYQTNLNWVEKLKSKAKELQHQHYLQRIQLELTLETTPRDSRYSSGLLELMKKEETVLRDQSSQSAKSIVFRVDEMLRAETQAFFRKSAQQNIRRWAALQEKFRQDRQSLIMDFGVVFRQISVEDFRDVVTADDLESESLRLECDYNRNWFEYENYSLQQAFKSQTARVDNDWNGHEVSIANDFKARKERLLGYAADATHSSVTASTTQDPRWQHPEKQKTLIHTAPVLSPSRAETTGAGGADSSRWARGKKDMELDRLDREYRVALDSLQKQKEEAQRWLLRQQVRLQAQAEEVQREKAAVADILEAELRDLQAVQRHVRAAASRGVDVSLGM